MNTFERPHKESLAAIIGVFVGAVVCVIYWGQLTAMQDQIKLARIAFVKDQRAWVNVGYDTDKMVDGTPLVTTQHFTNTGKSPARHVEGMIVTRKLKIGEDPRFVYDHGTNVTLGTMFPNSPAQDTISYLVPNNVPAGEKIQPTIVTPELRAEINSGSVYLVVYGRITYKDVFGGEHWITFCAPSTAVKYTNPPVCSNYNDVDQEDKP